MLETYYIFSLIAAISATVGFFAYQYRSMKDRVIESFKKKPRKFQQYSAQADEDIPTFRDVVDKINKDGVTYDPVAKQLIAPSGNLLPNAYLIYPVLGSFYNHVMNLNLPARTRRRALRRAVWYSSNVSIDLIKKGLIKNE